MNRFAPALAAALLAAGGPGPAAAQLFDPYIIGMMAGPVSDGPSVLLLKKREDKFMSPETVIIACSAGAVSGVVAHGLPALAAAASGIGAPLGAAALLGTGLFGCVVGAGAGATAIGTQWLLHRLSPAAPPRETGADAEGPDGRPPPERP
ncbi:MAG: hypothetical protein WCO00_12165 [Rhodospirillaceae bacterium]